MGSCVGKKVRTFSKKGVAKNSGSGIISPCRRAESAEATHSKWAFSSGGERFPDTEEVTSSNLVTPTICDADMAQLVEHHLAKVRVAGSNPVVRSIVLDELVGFSTSSLKDKTPGWRRGQVVRQRPAKPSPPVRIRASPPNLTV